MNKKKLIIKALKNGVAIRRLAKEIGVNERSIYRWIKADADLQMALNYHKSLIDNLFN